MTSIAAGGAQMGFSQEVVQEFQVSSVNFGLSAGMTDAGSINVVTRGARIGVIAGTEYFVAIDLPWGLQGNPSFVVTTSLK